MSVLRNVWERAEQFFTDAVSHPTLYFEKAECMEACFVAIQHILDIHENGFSEYRKFLSEDFGFSDQWFVASTKERIRVTEGRNSTERELFCAFAEAWCRFRDKKRDQKQKQKQNESEKQGGTDLVDPQH